MVNKLSLYYLINSNDSVNIFDSTYRNAIIEIRNISPPRHFSRGGGGWKLQNWRVSVTVWRAGNRRKSSTPFVVCNPTSGCDTAEGTLNRRNSCQLDDTDDFETVDHRLTTPRSIDKNVSRVESIIIILTALIQRNRVTLSFESFIKIRIKFESERILSLNRIAMPDNGHDSNYFVN